MENKPKVKEEIKQFVDSNIRTIANRSDMNERLVTGRVLHQAAQALYYRTGLDIEGAESRARAFTQAEIARLVGGAPEALDTLYEIAQVLAEKGEDLNALFAALETKADVDHDHTFADITGSIAQNQIAPNTIQNIHLAPNSVDGEVLENLPHGGLSVGPTTGQEGFDQTITVPQFTVDAQGRIVAATQHEFRIPEQTAQVHPYTGAPRPLGPVAQPGGSNEFSRGDHIHPLPNAEEVGAADRQHNHGIGDVHAGPAMVGGVETPFQSLGEELAIRPNKNEVDDQIVEIVSLQEGFITEEHVELRLGSENLVTRWDVVTREQIESMIDELFNSLPSA